jgi:hypothetical protein
MLLCPPVSLSRQTGRSIADFVEVFCTYRSVPQGAPMQMKAEGPWRPLEDSSQGRVSLDAVRRKITEVFDAGYCHCDRLKHRCAGFCVRSSPHERHLVCAPANWAQSLEACRMSDIARSLWRGAHDDCDAVGPYHPMADASQLTPLRNLNTKCARLV